MGGLLLGGKGCVGTPLKLLGGGAAPLFLRLCKRFCETGFGSNYHGLVV